MGSRSEERYLTTAEVARRLGVKPATVYAYVSRGQLASVPAPGGRGSLFAERDVAGLERRGGRRRRPAGAVERIATGLTLLDGDELYYRGRRATELAAREPVEAVAHLLWTGEPADRVFRAPAGVVAAARAAVGTLPGTARLTDRLRVAVAVAGGHDPLRFDLSTPAVVRAGETMLAVMVDALTVNPPGDGPLSRRLWPALTDRRERPGLLDAALVLLADHGLAASTVAARVAASARANPYAVVSAGLGALDGPYHGATSGLAYRFLTEALADPVAALSERLRAGGPPPGFGHLVYRGADPRAEALFALLRTDPAAGPVLRAVDTVAAELGRRDELFPNADIALAAVMHAHGMRPDAGEAVFAVARTVGWIAHAVEEYREPELRFRPVGGYTGVPPAHP